MTTTRATLLLTAGLATLALAAFAALELRLPVAEFFEYGTGTLVTAGLLTMLCGLDATPRRRTRRPAAPHSRPCRTAFPRSCAPVAS